MANSLRVFWLEMSADNIRWSLWNGTREVACVLRPLSEGSELATIYYAGLPLGTHICLSDSEAWQWANEHRARWEAQGWKARAEVTGL